MKYSVILHKGVLFPEAAKLEVSPSGALVFYDEAGSIILALASWTSVRRDDVKVDAKAA